jgi:hypothetical protein
MNFRFLKFKINFILIILVFLLTNNTSLSIEIERNIQPSELPSVFCWRDINGTDYTTSVKNQEPAPTCEAYALCASLETLIQYQIGYPFECDLSEIHLFFYPGGNIDWGVHVVDAANYLVEHGVPDEGCSPDPHRPFEFDYESLPGWENRTVKITEWGWVYNNRESIKRALIDHGPLVICAIIRTDFLYYKGGIYTHKWGRIKCGHVLNIVGYDDDQECWILKNSGGEGWGEDGYARFSYDAHNPLYPFFWPFYGGTGIMYIDGVYGNLNPDTPKVYIEFPKRKHTYILGHEIPTITGNLRFIQKGVPRIFGEIPIKVNVSNANKVEFYFDNQLIETIYGQPYELNIKAESGLHTIEVFAYNDNFTSKDILDVYFF